MSWVWSHRNFSKNAKLVGSRKTENTVGGEKIENVE